MSIVNVAGSQHFDLEACDVERAIGDMLGAGGRLGARVLGAENAIGFAAVT